MPEPALDSASHRTTRGVSRPPTRPATDADRARRHRGRCVALRTSIRDVLEVVTVADLAATELPGAIVKLTEDPEDWIGR